MTSKFPPQTGQIPVRSLAICLLLIAAPLPGSLLARGPSDELAKLDARSLAPWQLERDANGRVRQLHGSRTALPAGKGALQGALEFLKSSAALLGLASDGSDLEATRSIVGPTSTHHGFRKVTAGLPVAGSAIAVHLDEAGRVALVDNHWPEVTRLAPGAEAVGEAVAARIAVGTVGAGESEVQVRLSEKVLHVAAGLGTPAWRFQLSRLKPLVSREVLVSAMDGAVLASRDLLRSASGQVFRPNPRVFLQNFGITDQEDSDAAIPPAAFENVTFSKDSSDLLRGEFADVFSSFEGDRTSEPTKVYNYPRSDKRFEQVMVYYHVDNAQRFIKFRAGLQDLANPGPLAMFAHGDSTQNAFYSPTDKILVFGDGGADAAEDADVIVHEYGHAVLDHIVTGIEGSEGDSLHEGFADFLASSVLSEFTVSGGGPDPDPACTAEWFTSELATSLPTTVRISERCLRRVDDAEGFLKYPDLLSTSTEVHFVGQAYARFLWDIRNGITDLGTGLTRPGIGNVAGVKLSVGAAAFMTNRVTLVTGARAVLTQDQVASNGANAPLIVQSGIRRGFMNVSVSSISPTFIPLGTTVPVQILGDSFAGASGLRLSDGSPVIDFTVESNNLIAADIPARTASGKLTAIVSNMGTTGTGISAITVDDHPNSAAEVVRLGSVARDTLVINSQPVQGSVEVATVPVLGGQEVDFYRFTAIRDHSYNIRTGAGSARDTKLSVFGPDGTTLIAFNDDRDSLNGDLTSEVTVEASGLSTTTTTFFVKVELPAGSTGTYTLTIIDPEAPDDHPNDALATRVPADVVSDTGSPAASGAIDYAGDVDFFRFEAQPGAVYDLRCDLDTLTDSVLAVMTTRTVQIDGETKDELFVLAENDDTDESFGRRNSFISAFQTSRKGTHYLRVRHFDTAETAAVGTYRVSVTRKQASLDVRSVTVPVSRVSAGQTFPVTVSVANSGINAVGFLSATLQFSSEGKTRSTEFSAQPVAGNATSLTAGKSADLEYLVTASTRTVPGSVKIDASASATDLSLVTPVSDPASAATATVTVQTPASLAVNSVTAIPSLVSRGQSLPVTVSISNSGQASAAVTSVSITFRGGGADLADDYEVEAEPAFEGDNPGVLAGGASGLYRFQVAVSAAARTGPVALDATVNGIDLNTSAAIPADQTANVPDSWTVQTPATLALTRIEGPGERLSSGSSAPVTLSLSNGGQAAMDLTAVVFTVRDAATADRTLDYVISPRTGNPARVSGGGSAKLVFDAAASSTAATGAMSLTVSVQARDSNASTPFTTTGNGLASSFVVERPAALSITAVAASAARVSRGQSVQVTATVENGGGASAKSIGASLSFRSSTGANLGGEYTVTAGSANPVTLAGGATGTFEFTVAASAAASGGLVSIGATATGKDANSSKTVTSGDPGPEASWIVESPASLAIRSLDLSPAVLSRGGTLALTLAVENLGGAAAKLGSATFRFLAAGSVDRAGEYLFLPSGSNPVELAGGGSGTLRFTASSPTNATTGSFQVSATLAGTDANSGSALTTTTADTQRKTLRLGFLRAAIASPKPGDLLFSDEPVTLTATAVEDTGAAVPDSGIVWTSGATTLGTGATIVATLPAGAHPILLRATSSGSLTSSVQTFIQVQAPLPPANLLIVTGALTRSSGGAAGPGHSIVVTNLTRGSALTAQTNSAGQYTVIFSDSQSSVAGTGDVLGLIVTDGAGRRRVVFPATAVVKSRDLHANGKVLDLVLADLSEIRFELVPGLNLVSFPAQPAVTAGASYGTAELLRDTGAHLVSYIPATGDPARDRLRILTQGGNVPGDPIEGHQGYLISMPASRTLTLPGNPWSSGAADRLLIRGRNFLGLPLGVSPGADSATLSAATSSSVVIRAITGPNGRGRFDTWTSGSAAFPLQSGRGYIVVPARPGRIIRLP